MEKKVKKENISNNQKLFYYVYTPLIFLFGLTSGDISNDNVAFRYLTLFLLSLPISYWIMIPLSFQTKFTIHQIWHLIAFSIALALGLKIGDPSDFLIDLSITYSIIGLIIIVIIGAILLFLFRLIAKIGRFQDYVIQSSIKWLIMFVAISTCSSLLINTFVIKGPSNLNPSIGEVESKLIIVLNRFQNHCISDEREDYNSWCDDLKTAFLEVDGKYNNELKSPLDDIGPSSYALNENLQKYEISKIPDDFVILFDSKPGWNQIGGAESIQVRSYNGIKGIFICYWYGPEFIPENEIPKLKWDIEN